MACIRCIIILLLFATPCYASGTIISDDSSVTGSLTVGGNRDVVQFKIDANASQTNKLLDIRDSADDSVTWVTSEGKIHTEKGVRASCGEWADGLSAWAYGTYVKENNNSGTGYYDHTGNAKGETVFYDTTNSPFQADDEAKFLVIQSGTYKGAKALITNYIDADYITVFGAGWDADISGVDYFVTNSPSFIVGDNHRMLTSVSTDGVHIFATDQNTGYIGNDNSNSAYATQFLAGEDNTDAYLHYIDVNGYNNVDGTQFLYQTRGIETGDSLQVLQVSLNEREAKGGEIDCILLETTDACTECEKHAIHVGGGFDAALIITGAQAIDPEFGYEVTNTVTSDAVNSWNGGDDAFINDAVNRELFDNDNDYILIGSSATFEVLEVIVTVESSKNIKSTFQYSTGNGTWGDLIVDDGTQGFQNSGLIDWTAPGDWATSNETENAEDIQSAYYIRINRTVGGTIPTLPTELFFKIFTEQGGDTGMTISGDGTIKLPYLTGAPAGLENGKIWVEVDGLHIYYNNAEKTIAGV